MITKNTARVTIVTYSTCILYNYPPFQVKVLSDPTAEIGEDALVNLAYLKPTSQSSTGWGGVPDRAVDGKESGTWSK